MNQTTSQNNAHLGVRRVARSKKTGADQPVGAAKPRTLKKKAELPLRASAAAGVMALLVGTPTFADTTSTNSTAATSSSSTSGSSKSGSVSATGASTNTTVSSTSSGNTTTGGATS